MKIRITPCLRTDPVFSRSNLHPQCQAQGHDPELQCPHRPGEQAGVVVVDRQPVGRILTQPFPTLPASGNLALFESVPDPEVGKALLEWGFRHLVEQGVRQVFGPLDGDTWHGYRTSRPGPGPTFALDRRTPTWHGDHFAQSGFQVCDRYHSRWIPRDALAWDRLDRNMARCQRNQVEVAPLDLEDWDSTIRQLHEVSLEAFADNRLASPLELPEFAHLYAPLRGRLPPGSLVGTRDREGRLLSFLFCLPDLTARGPALVLKTVAIRREPLARGMGALLVELAHRRAHREGMAGVIHALIHEENTSDRILSSKSEVIRRYELWRRDAP